MQSALFIFSKRKISRFSRIFTLDKKMIESRNENKLKNINRNVINDVSELILGHIKNIDEMRQLCESILNNEIENSEIKEVFYSRNYCHPSHPLVEELVNKIPIECRSNSQKAKWLFDWFVQNLKYGRLMQPLFPLVRTDTDVLQLLEGTCGDFSNLFVSCMDYLFIQAKYVRVDRDVYGDEQNHICAAFFDEDRWILVDPTLSYDKISGWDIKHKEYRLISKEEHWNTLRKEEYELFMISLKKYKTILLSGVIFAPWIHEEIIDSSADETSTLFILLTLTKELDWQLWITYHIQSPDQQSCPIRIRSTEKGKYEWDQCISESFGLWDEKRWESRGFVSNLEINTNQYLTKSMDYLKKNKEKLFSLISLIESERVSVSSRIQ